MLAIHNHHDQLTRQMRNRLRTAKIGLGLVRLLQDLGRAEEAKTTLASLESCLQGTDQPRQKHCHVNRVKNVEGRLFFPASGCE